MNIVLPTTPVTPSVDDLITEQYLEVPVSQGDTSQKTLPDLAKLMKGPAEKSRLQLLLILGHHGEMPLGELARLTKQKQPTVSHHLEMLRTVGLVAKQPGHKGGYYLNSAGFHQLGATLRALHAHLAAEPPKEP